MTHLRAGAIEEAAALFARAAEHDPANAAIATDYGFALAGSAGGPRRSKVLRGAIDKDPKRFYAYVNLADLWATDPARWERRDAAVAFLEKGLDALKDDRKGRFNLLLGLAGFERAIGRTAAARARLAPLLAPEARAAVARAAQAGARSARRDRARRAGARARGLAGPAIAPGDLAPARARRSGRGRAPARGAARRSIRWSRRAPSWARARIARAAGARGAPGASTRRCATSRSPSNLAPSNARGLARARAAARRARRRAGAGPRRRGAQAGAHAGAGLVRSPRAARAHRPPPRGRQPAGARAPPAPARRSAPARSTRRRRSGSISAIRRASGAIVSRRRSPTRPGSSRPPCRCTRSPARCRRRPPTRSPNDGPGLWALASGVRKLGKAEQGAAPDSTATPDDARARRLDRSRGRARRAGGALRAGGVAGGERRSRGRARGSHRLRRARARAPSTWPRRRRCAPGSATAPGRAARRARRPRCSRASACSRTGPTPPCARSGGTCTAELPPDRLIALGAGPRVRRPPRARRAPATSWAATRRCARLARLDARLPDAELRAADRRPLARGRRARHRRGRVGARPPGGARGRRGDGARPDRARAGAGRPERHRRGRLDPRGARRRASASPTRAAARRARARIAAGAPRSAALALAAAGADGLRAAGAGAAGRVAAALRRRPGLYPEVGRAVGELRHDVLKHRAGVLGLGRRRRTPTRAEIARALSRAAADLDRCGRDLRPARRRRARRRRPTLRPLAREPVFGALARDLARAEALLARPRRAPTTGPSCCAIDERLRGAHADALGDLLHLGPRTRLDAAALSTWIAAVEAAARRVRRRLDRDRARARRPRRRLPRRERRPGGDLRQPAAQRPDRRRRPARRAGDRARRSRARRDRPAGGHAVRRRLGDRSRSRSRRSRRARAAAASPSSAIWSAPGAATWSCAPSRRRSPSWWGRASRYDRPRPRFVVCEDGSEYLDRFRRFLGDGLRASSPAARLRDGARRRRRRRRPAPRSRLPPHARPSAWSTSTAPPRAALDAGTRARLAETQGILILRQLRAAGVDPPRHPVRRSRRPRAGPLPRIDPRPARDRRQPPRPPRDRRAHARGGRRGSRRRGRGRQRCPACYGSATGSNA